VPILREFKEMAYQYVRDYFFNSNKVEITYGFKPTPPHESKQWVVDQLAKSGN
jgi:hypothetical protein